MVREHNIPFDKLSVGRRDIYEAIGYGTETPDEDILKIIEESIERATSLGVARFMYLTTEGCLTNKTLQIADQTFCIGPVIANQLAGSEEYALFVATTGQAFEKWLEEVKLSDDIVLQFITNSIGSCFAEKAADHMEQYLEQEILPKGLKHTNRFSPGYCNWSVSEQQKLFSLFPTPTPCGVRLTPSSLMVPVKSVSGIIGIGEQVKRTDYPCGLCGLERCYKRGGGLEQK